MFTTHSVTPERDACVDCKGLPDRGLFTHPDRHGAVKNCTIFPLKSRLILGSYVFTAASLSPLSPIFLPPLQLYTCTHLYLCIYVV